MTKGLQIIYTERCIQWNIEAKLTLPQTKNHVKNFEMVLGISSCTIWPEGWMLSGIDFTLRMLYINRRIFRGLAKNLSDEQREAMRREHGFETSGPALKVLKK